MKQTDLQEVKEIAKAFLRIDISTTEFSPIIVQHPFTTSGVVCIKDGNEMKLVDITADLDALESWRATMDSIIDNEKTAYGIYMLFNKVYALVFLNYAEPHLSRKDFSQILSSAWTIAEAPNQDCNVTKQEMLSMFRKADPAFLMEAEEFDAYNHLDDTIAVYRGVTSHNAKNIKALSWTLDIETAKFFANRFGESGTIYKAEIDKRHIFAYFASRGESEVIVDPEHLEGITAL